jgi:hypothetical protein
LTVPVADDSGLARKLGRQEPVKQPVERTQLVRFSEDRLQRGFGREYSVELGRTHKAQGREWSCRLS